eukprot:NODE_4555_length_1047_cov_118.136364_g4352_i0.p1 GENE.NODE_4555_length_1047_cov_118.136364_g4352_i0~~NODE_4555_length_1047_cov_118.136364_g4352_i0.p1  ORF type:complete len:268 (+),score=47.74 NODE_4555_length_1047_cov_118.136364_g4352_i0:58-804(+)
MPKKAPAPTTRSTKGEVVFADFPDFRPNLTPEEVLRQGSFGGTYFRTIHSSVTKQTHSGAWKELPSDWIKGLKVSTMLAAPWKSYDAGVNKYKVKSGQTLEAWEESGWIHPQDPFGWFQWYCRFYQGRRSEDDERQVSRWKKCCGARGRWKGNLVAKVLASGKRHDDPSVSPVVRQTLHHWARPSWKRYVLTEQDCKPKGRAKAAPRVVHASTAQARPTIRRGGSAGSKSKAKAPPKVSKKRKPIAKK